jgi:hypothetical protein
MMFVRYPLRLLSLWLSVCQYYINTHLYKYIGTHVRNYKSFKAIITISICLR